MIAYLKGFSGGWFEQLKLAVYGFFVWLNISIEVFTILMVLMLLDSILGGVKAVRLGKKFSFKVMLWGISLKLCFLIVPLIIALLGKQMEQDFSIAVDIVIKILSVSEVYSIFGNIYSAKNKVEVKKLDAISLLLKSLRKSLEILVKRLIEKLEQINNCKIE